MNTHLLNRAARYFIIAAAVFFLSPVNAQTNCGDPSFPAPAEVLTNVSEAAGYNLVYHLPMPAANQAWATQADVPYLVNNSASLTGSSFTRVAYYVKLESALLGPQWVWVSMDAFTNDLGQISIPTGSISFQQSVTNMNVVHYAQPARTGITGNIEFWSNCYNATNAAGVAGASDFGYDFGDEIIPGENCYGSFQVHDPNSLETIFAYNGWAFAGATAEDLGIGNFPSSNTDWTLADNAALYDVRELYVFVDAGPSYQPTCNPVSILLDAAGQASITSSMVTDAVVGNCGFTDVNLSQSNFDCSDLGENIVTVTVTRNGTPITCTSIVTVNDEIVPSISATGTTLQLECEPTDSEIDAALGSAIASDNCGDPGVQVVTDPVILNGANNTQVRHFTSTDAAGNTVSTSRTVSWPAECNVDVQNIYPANVSCGGFVNGAMPLLYICYTHDRNKVKKVSPKQFYYYAVVKAPAVLGPGSSFYADVVQTKSCASFKLFGIQGNQIRAHDAQCSKVSNGSEVSTGQGRVKISNAVPGGTYIISVKYEGKALEGSSFTGAAPICSNSFETRVTVNGAFGTGALVAGSQTSIEERPNCTVPDPDDVENRVPFAAIGEMQDVVASPNPSSNYFEIDLSDRQDEVVTIRIFNSNGKLIQSLRGSSSTIIRIGDKWQNGIYFAEVLTASSRKTIRLVKSR